MFLLISLTVFWFHLTFLKQKIKQKVSLDIGGSNPIAFLDPHDITNKKIIHLKL